MTFKAKTSLPLCILAIFIVSPFLHQAQSISDIKFTQSSEKFAAGLYSQLGHSATKVIYSPFSLQTCVGMIRMGANGETATEIDRVFGLSPQDSLDMATNYRDILAQYQNSSVLKIVNRINVMQDYKVKTNFRGILTNKFFSSVEEINFANNVEAAQTINNWVQQETNNKIRDLIKPSLLDANTRMVLVNALYFKAAWKHPFNKKSTTREIFYLDNTRKTLKIMMNIKETFNYGEFSELDATALEMRYQNSDISMLIILPNTKTGLSNLDTKLNNLSIADLRRRMSSKTVRVKIPKFKAIFKAELSPVLKKMGVTNMFAENADLTEMVQDVSNLKVSSIIHQASIEVTEEGTEAAAATAVTIILSGGFNINFFVKDFYANRPFHYIITNRANIRLFEGNFRG